MHISESSSYAGNPCLRLGVPPHQTSERRPSGAAWHQKGQNWRRSCPCPSGERQAEHHWLEQLCLDLWPLTSTLFLFPPATHRLYSHHLSVNPRCQKVRWAETSADFWSGLMIRGKCKKVHTGCEGDDRDTVVLRERLLKVWRKAGSGPFT